MSDKSIPNRYTPDYATHSYEDNPDFSAESNKLLREYVKKSRGKIEKEKQLAKELHRKTVEKKKTKQLKVFRIWLRKKSMGMEHTRYGGQTIVILSTSRDAAIDNIFQNMETLAYQNMKRKIDRDDWEWTITNLEGPFKSGSILYDSEA